MKRPISVTIAVLLASSVAALATAPTDFSSFLGKWQNAIIANGTPGTPVIASFEIVDYGQGYGVLTFNIAGTIPITYYASLYFYSSALDSPVATYAQWERKAHENEPHSLFGVLEASNNSVIMEVFFRGLSSGVTDYRVREVFVRVPEEEPASEG